MNTSPYLALRNPAEPCLSDTGTSLPLDGPVVAFDTPVEIGRSLWGPFHRLYLQAEAAGHSHTITSGAFTTEARPDGALRIATTLHVPAAAGLLRADIRLERAADGGAGEAVLEAAVGPGDAALEALRAGLGNPVGLLRRGWLGMGELFELGAAGAGGPPLLGRVLGRSHHQGREVLVARRSGTRPVAEPGWGGRLVAEGHVAVDVETAVVLLSALGCRLGEAGPAVRLQGWFTLQGRGRSLH